MSLNMQDDSSRSLKRALLANALFSGLCGLVIVLAEPLVIGWLGMQSISIWPLGAMLLTFSVYLLWMSRASSVSPLLVRGVIFSDWAWVAGTAVLLLMQAAQFSRTGIILLIDVALLVGVFAVLQSRGLNSACVRPIQGLAK